MAVKEKVIASWSGGKDSALAVYEILKSEDYELTALVTTVTADYDRISMHGVRCKLLEQQAQSIGVPLDKVLISKNSSNEEYESQMREVLEKHQAKGVNSIVIGDIFLEDLRKYREENLSKIGYKGIFPLWKIDTTELAHRFIGLGFKAVISCIDSKLLDKKFAGSVYDHELLDQLPEDIDPCGENGEFHSFVYDGPIFKNEIAHKTGDVVLKDNRFYFCDLVPV